MKAVRVHDYGKLRPGLEPADVAALALGAHRVAAGTDELDEPAHVVLDFVGEQGAGARGLPARRTAAGRYGGGRSYAQRHRAGGAEKALHRVAREDG